MLQDRPLIPWRRRIPELVDPAYEPGYPAPYLFALALKLGHLLVQFLDSPDLVLILGQKFTALPAQLRAMVEEFFYLFFKGLKFLATHFLFSRSTRFN